MIALKETNPVYIEVIAKVRYWEDAEVNGIGDKEGDLIPFRQGENWRVTIRLDDGKVLDWPPGVTANIHYKVCDEGTYFLLNKEMERVATQEDCYVPDRYLCVGGEGWGDYIILNITSDGMIEGWKENPYEKDPHKERDWIPTRTNPETE